MSHKPKIAIIIASTRPTRFGDIPAAWIKAQADARDDLETELVDLRDYPMTLFAEVASNAWAPTQDPVAVKWQRKLAEFDGYIFVTPEYNRSIPGVLKNALDQANVEWAHKPLGAVGYGSTGATNAIGHLQNIGVELQMVSVRSNVRIAGSDFFKVHLGFGGSGNMADIEGGLLNAARGLLDDLVWWANATRAAKQDSLSKAA